ncbi:MAG: LysR family transcriptional regulator [Alphaproteobacteria bacterium]
MNVRQLEAFQAVFTTGLVSTAAGQLGVTQPAVSTLISNLENDIGFPLFERIRGRLIATPEAATLYGEVESVFASLERVAHTIHDIRTMSAGHLHIASMPGATIKLFPLLITPFLDGRPDVSLNLYSRSSPKVRDWVATGQVDLGLAEMPIDNKAIEWEPLIQRCVLIMPTGHRLTKKEVLTPSDIKDESLISLYGGHMVSRRLESAFEDAGLIRKSRLEVNLFSTCCNLVHEGAGVALVDPMSADHFRDHNIAIRPFEPAIHFDIAILFPANRPHSQLASEFAQTLKNGVRKYLVR